MGTRIGIAIGIGAQILVTGQVVPVGGFDVGFSDGFN